MNYMKLFGLAAFAIGAILYLASSDDHELVMGDQNYDMGEYVNISDNSSVILKVYSGREYSLNVKADQNDLAMLKIYVKGQTLVIKNKNDEFQSWHGGRPEITISLPRIKKYTLNGSSDVEIEDIHGSFFKAVVNGSGEIKFTGASEELVAEVNGSGYLHSPSFDAVENTININGSGAIAIAGECGSLEIGINGSGDISGKDYTCEKVEVDISGSGNLEVYAGERLDVDINGSGKVRVYGKPEKVTDRSRHKNHIIIQ